MKSLKENALNQVDTWESCSQGKQKIRKLWHGHWQLFTYRYSIQKMNHNYCKITFLYVPSISYDIDIVQLIAFSMDYLFSTNINIALQDTWGRLPLGSSWEERWLLLHWHSPKDILYIFSPSGKRVRFDFHSRFCGIRSANVRYTLFNQNTLSCCYDSLYFTGK